MIYSSFSYWLNNFTAFFMSHCFFRFSDFHLTSFSLTFHDLVIFSFLFTVLLLPLIWLDMLRIIKTFFLFFMNGSPWQPSAEVLVNIVLEVVLLLCFWRNVRYWVVNSGIYQQWLHLYCITCALDLTWYFAHH